MANFLENLIKSLAIAFIAFIIFIGIGSNITDTNPLPYKQTEVSTLPKKNAEPAVKNSPASTLPKETPPATVKNPTAEAPKVIPAPAPEQPPVTKTNDVLKISIIPDTSSEMAPAPSVSEVNDLVRNASVNILCTSAISSIHSITGSGVIIDSRGVILTNAHIGQYFLLKDYPSGNNVDCTIRTGSPAVPRYHAQLIFISPEWVQNNSQNLKQEDPLGTGENDFALLVITGATNPNDSLPTSFPALTVNTDEFTEESALAQNYIIAGYPAGFLGGIAVIKDLFIASTVVRANQVFTFKESTVDLLSFGGNILAQKGASGSAVVRQSDEKLVGVIVTTTEAATTGERELRAITTTHINRSLLADTDKTLPQFISGDLQGKINDFNAVSFQPLTKILTSGFN